MEKALVVNNLVKTYGSLTAVDELNLEIKTGETFGLLGHNGAGKSTSIECILGVKKPDKGSIRVLGMDPVVGRKKLFERVGVQFQQTSYQDKITVSEICEVTHSLYKSPVDWRDLLQTFGLADKQKRLVSELSGGERQKLSVLLALIPDPELFFFDELTTGLDSKARRDIWKYLEKLKQKGHTIILTSHYMDEVEVLCDRICILKKGRIVDMGTVPELIGKSPYESLEDAYLWYSGEEDAINESL